MSVQPRPTSMRPGHPEVSPGTLCPHTSDSGDPTGIYVRGVQPQIALSPSAFATFMGELSCTLSPPNDHGHSQQQPSTTCIMGSCRCPSYTTKGTNLVSCFQPSASPPYRCFYVSPPLPAITAAHRGAQLHAVQAFCTLSQPCTVSPPCYFVRTSHNVHMTVVP